MPTKPFDLFWYTFNQEKVFATIVILVGGLVVGSFLTSFVGRIMAGRNWINDRSRCPECHTSLGPGDLVPILSWLALRGRCRHCRTQISWQYPAIEAMSAGVFVGLYHWWPLRLTAGVDWAVFGFWLVVATGLMALTVADFRHLILPDKILRPLSVLVVVFSGLQAGLIGFDYLLDLIWSSLVFGGGLYLIYLLSRGQFGLGDVKLGFTLGLLLANWQLSLMAILLAGWLGVDYRRSVNNRHPTPGWQLAPRLKAQNTVWSAVNASQLDLVCWPELVSC